MNNKIAVFGLGYVGSASAILLAQHNEVIAIDIDEARVKSINNKLPTVQDNMMEDFLSSTPLNLQATTDQLGFLDCNFIVIALPTNFNDSNKSFDTEIIEETLCLINKHNKSATIIIKSTIPVGFSRKMNAQFDSKNIIFSPEFLREGAALEDSLYPSRIIVGSLSKQARDYSELVMQATFKKDITVQFISSDEAESVKLFSNTYLAMRVSFFNELDNFALLKNLNSQSIIEGVCLDDRIGNFYNNPSFGYGGYCLPKDTKQLLFEFGSPSNDFIASIEKSNLNRAKRITETIFSAQPSSIGVYLLSMKADSDNFRSSPVLNVIKLIRAKDIPMYIYDPSITKKEFMGLEVCNDLKIFKSRSDLIIANRNSEELGDVQEKIFTRDIFGNN
jgi:UDPglucose 6-dehydrogenase